MSSDPSKRKKLVKEFLTLLWWNVLAYLALTALVGSQFNLEGVYGQL
jgi:hypothetical protein